MRLYIYIYIYIHTYIHTYIYICIYIYTEALKVMRERSADEKLLALVFKVLYCCFTSALLLFYCCFTSALLLLY